MSEAEHLASELAFLFSSAENPWFPSFLRTLDGCDAAAASRVPGAGLNSVWATVNHVSFWLDLAGRRLRGDPATGADVDESGWSVSASGTDADWRRVRALLAEQAESAALAIAALTATELEAPWAPGHATRWQVAHGLINHTSHHAADVLTARRLLGIPV